MFKKIKKVILLMVMITAIIIAGMYYYTNNRTYMNKSDEIGNTAGNIYNGGLFCEQDKRIYFSNNNDNGNLYVMNDYLNNFRLISTDKAVYINADPNYIYYVRANSSRENNPGAFIPYNNVGIFRIKENGSGLTSVTNNPGAYLMLKGNYLYYQHYNVNSGLFLYQNKIDCSYERLILKEAVIPASINDKNLYYAGTETDHNIHSINLQSFTNQNELDGDFLHPVFFEDYIYYMDIRDHYKIYRMKQDGSDVTKLVDKQCSTFNITKSGKYLYYQQDNGSKSKICRLNLNTMSTQTLAKGNYSNINVTEYYVFFNKFKSSKTYYVSADGSPTVNSFNPPNLSK